MDFVCKTCCVIKKLPLPPNKDVRICNHTTAYVITCRRCSHRMYHDKDDDKLCTRCANTRFKFIL